MQNKTSYQIQTTQKQQQKLLASQQNKQKLPFVSLGIVIGEEDTHVSVVR